MPSRALVRICAFSLNDTLARRICLARALLKEAKVLVNAQRSFPLIPRPLRSTARSVAQVMDECTASVDVQVRSPWLERKSSPLTRYACAQTDAKIQMMVRQQFAQCTVLTIAHRLATIIDYDQIVVLEQGKLVEIGAPGELLEKVPAGPFARLVEETGDNQSAHLR